MNGNFFRLGELLCLLCLCIGCGTTKSRLATEQLLLSDAVDRSVASIDFRPLSGRSVYLDTQYVQAYKGNSFVNADYIVSSLRQQMLAARCYLEESKDQAEYIAEIRVGALGTDAHDVVYGIPASNGLSNAASLLPNAPPIPAIPEISLAKKNDEVGAAKIAVFAYHRESKEAVWQSGLAQARSTAKDTWLFGAGPFQRGTIHDKTHFAGEALDIPLMPEEEGEDGLDPMARYRRRFTFVQPPKKKEVSAAEGGGVQQASHAEAAPPATPPPAPPADNVAAPQTQDAPATPTAP